MRCALIRKDLQRGEVEGTGEPTVLKDSGAVVCWDGAAGWPDQPPLNGLYTTAKAVETALDRSFEHGVATVAFGGADRFDQQTSFIAACARASPPAASGQPVTPILFLPLPP